MACYPTFQRSNHQRLLMPIIGIVPSDEPKAGIRKACHALEVVAQN
jgi:hypothetical protein